MQDDQPQRHNASTTHCTVLRNVRIVLALIEFVLFAKRSHEQKRATDLAVVDTFPWWQLDTAMRMRVDTCPVTPPTPPITTAVTLPITNHHRHHARQSRIWKRVLDPAGYIRPSLVRQRRSMLALWSQWEMCFTGRYSHRFPSRTSFNNPKLLHN